MVGQNLGWLGWVRSKFCFLVPILGEISTFVEEKLESLFSSNFSYHIASPFDNVPNKEIKLICGIDNRVVYSRSKRC